MATAAAAARGRQAVGTQGVVAVVIGNVLEWYDFAVYGYFAPILGQLFFPSEDRVASLLAAFGVFAVGYAARPLGGAIFGHIGDRIGRSHALLLSVALMGGGTLAIGVLPVYGQIGLWAALLLVALRVLQGISVGGEYSGSVVYLAETAHPKRRGFVASWPEAGSLMGFLLGSGLGALLSTLLSQAELEAWGWRIPFLLGAVLALASLAIRRHMPEPPAPRRRLRTRGSPVMAAIRDEWKAIGQMICLLLVNSIGFYLLFVYAASYLTEEMHVSTARALDVSSVSLLAMLVVTPLAAWFSDRVGRKPMLYAAALGCLFLSWPLWWLMHHPRIEWILAGQLGFAVLFAIGYAVTSAAMVEMLPRHVRCSGVAIGYNVCLGVFGGTTPLIATYLVERTADDFAPVYYLMGAALLSLVVTFRMPETARKPLR